MVFAARFFITGISTCLSLNDAFCRADSDTGGRIGITGAFGAGSCIDNIVIITGRDCIDRAFWFASSAVGAFFGDIQCHIDDVLNGYKK
jgi:hypothetical protein